MSESEVKPKRKKCSSYSKEDELRLLNAIYLKRKIIENKETKKLGIGEKDKASGRVGVVFNTNAVEFRNIDQLKAKFDNLKTKTRKTVAKERAYFKGTGGGGTLVSNNDPMMELVFKIIHWKTVLGLENVFDSDGIAGDIVDERNEMRNINDKINIQTISEFEFDDETRMVIDNIDKENEDDNLENGELETTVKKASKTPKHVWNS